MRRQLAEYSRRQIFCRVTKEQTGPGGGVDPLLKEKKKLKVRVGAGNVEAPAPDTEEEKETKQQRLTN
jgi:hypothetical protein